MDTSTSKNKSRKPSNKPVKQTKSKKGYLKRLNTALNKNKTNQISKRAVSESAKKVKISSTNSVAEDARLRLESARFRFLNEKLYTSESHQAWKIFQQDPESFDIYHKGFRHQIQKWPINPLDVIIKKLLELPQDLVVGDFGCGEARLSLSLPNKVHSFDLAALNDRVTVCDMKNVPLPSKSLDVGVYCLSLMGSNLNDFLFEGNRLLKMGCTLLIAEVESRCGNVPDFIKSVEKFGFKSSDMVSYSYFFLAQFKKVKNVNSSFKSLPQINLKPCVYKKR